MVNIRRSGRDTTKSKSAICSEDFPKIYEVFSDTPQGLQYRVFFEVGIHFGRRGREGLRELKKDSFVLKRNSEGREYVEMAVNEFEKTKQGKNVREKEKCAAMFDCPESADCPVWHFKKYMSKLHKDLDAFYQRPLETWEADSEVWYAKVPLGKNKLAAFMAKISEAAKLEEIYTNHCLRATCATALDRAGFKPHEIITVTGHKHVQSLQPYIGVPTMTKRLELSSALLQYKGVKQTSKNPEEKRGKPSTVQHFDFSV